ncbi:hypothetical protein M8J75_012584 [Diaphorina citri]|nr:hypothetical protein M8J75_012584 [Diaphorina citri]KAI5728148.1 hypothetical protein M8J77_012229 [Diaphorina citri]
MMGETSGPSPMDSVILATGGYDHTIKLWQAASGICTRTMQHADSQVNALRITPDKQLLASAGYQHIRMYDFGSNNPNPVINCEGVSKNVVEVGFQEDGKWMFTGGEDCRARIWDLRSRSTLQCTRIFQVSAPVTCVCLHPNQGELIVGDQSGVVHIWDLRTDHNEQLVPAGNNDSSIQSLHVDSQSQRLAAVNSLGTCYVWQLSDPSRADPNAAEVISETPPPSPSPPRCTKATPTHKMAAHRAYGLHCVFSPDCRLLATTSADQTARIWNTEDFSLVRELGTANQRWVWDAAFTLDSKFLLTASSDGVARLWNIETGEVDKEYSGHQKAITSLAFCDVGVPLSPAPVPTERNLN